MTVERTLGVLPISIATSLALEGLLNIHPDLPKSKVRPVDSIRILWINLSTLVRNIYNSYPSEVKSKLTTDDLVDILSYEVSYIDGLISSETKDSVNVVFYKCSYNSLVKYLPTVTPRKYTPAQLVYKTIHDSVLKSIPSFLDGIDYREYDVSIKGSSKSVILTHMPIDLLSYYNFGSLQLLESHTGKLKPKNTWGGKLGGMASEKTPFNGFTMQVFGDGGGLVTFMSLKHRRAVVDMAEKDSWTVVTTPARIKMSIQKHADDDIKPLLLEALSGLSFNT